MKQLIACFLALALLLCLCGCEAIMLSADEYMAQTETLAPGPGESAQVPGASATPIPSPEATSTPVPGNPHQSYEPDYTHGAGGYLDGDRYINEVYGFSATLPERWIFSTDKDIEWMYAQLLPLEYDFIRPKDAERYLMVCSQYPLLTSTYNPNIIITASDAYSDSFFELYGPLLEEMQTVYTDVYTAMGAQTVDITGDPSLMFNGKEYMHFSIVCDYGSYMTYQHIYCTLVGSYVVTITHSYYQPEGQAIMDAFMQSVVFDS